MSETNPQISKVRRYVLYLPTPFKKEEGKNKEVLEIVTEIVKKLLRGTTVSARGRGIYVSRCKRTGRLKEFDEDTHTVEILTTDRFSGVKMQQVAYGVLAALDARYPEKKHEEVVMYTEEEVVQYQVANPDYDTEEN